MEAKLELIRNVVCKKCNNSEVEITGVKRERFSVIFKAGKIQWNESKYYEYLDGSEYISDIITKIECLKCGATGDKETIEEKFEVK